MKIHDESHIDHHLTDAQKDYALARFADRAAFFIETFELPPELGTVPCGLHGPIMGDEPVSDGECDRVRRGERAWSSRVCARAPRPTRTLTVIAGPHGEHACIVYTMFGGPQAPQEPGEIRRQLEAAELERRERDAKDGDPADGAMDLDKRAALDPLYAKIVGLRKKREESDTFWRDHALSK